LLERMYQTTSPSSIVDSSLHFGSTSEKIVILVALNCVKHTLFSGFHLHG
jgi:hypothetical protein